MGMLLSCVDTIRKIRFTVFRNDAVKRDLVGVIVEEGYVYALAKNGTVYTTEQVGRQVAYAGTGSDYPAIRALHRLGVITKAERRQHGEASRVRNAEMARVRALAVDLRNLENAGIVLTPKQVAKLKRLRKDAQRKAMPSVRSAL